MSFSLERLPLTLRQMQLPHGYNQQVLMAAAEQLEILRVQVAILTIDREVLEELKEQHMTARVKAEALVSELAEALRKAWSHLPVSASGILPQVEAALAAVQGAEVRE